MKVELDKRDIIHLLRGVEPSYDTMGLIEDMELGSYTGGFEDKFDWKHVTSVCWDRYSDEELYELYNKLTKEYRNDTTKTQQHLHHRGHHAR